MKGILISFGVVLLLAIAVAIYLAFSAPGIMQSRGFHFLEPSYLPPGVKIVRKTLFVDRHGSYPTLSFRTVDNVYSINESTAQNATNLTTSDDSYSPTSIKPTCRQVTTGTRSPYRLCHWIDYSFYNVYEINFVHDGTWCYIDMNAPYGIKEIPISELSKFVSSFHPASGWDLRVNGFILAKPGP